jgi:hypothetical protein
MYMFHYQEYLLHVHINKCHLNILRFFYVIHTYPNSTITNEKQVQW